MAGPRPIRLAARALALPGSAPGPVALAALDGMPAPLAVARVAFATPGLAALGQVPGLLAGGWPGHALAPAGTSTVVAGTAAWLLAPAPATVEVTPMDFPPGAAVTAVLPAGLAAALPVPAAQDGHVALWRVQSGAGQPSLGGGSGVAENGAAALAAAPLTLRGSEGLRVRISRAAPALAPARAVQDALQATIPPGTALPVTLPAGDKLVELGLPPGVAAFAGWHDRVPVAVWGGAAPVSRTLAGDWTELLLVNTGRHRRAGPPGAAARARGGRAAARHRAEALLRRGRLVRPAVRRPGRRACSSSPATPA